MIADLKSYPAMKDSDVPWLGDVPEHWDMERAKWMFRKRDRPVRDSDEVVTCFRDGVVTLRKNRRVRGFTESIKEIGYQGIRRGDLVIHAMDAFAGAIGVADSDGKGTPVYSVCEPSADVNSHYYAYTVREMARSLWILALAKGIRERSTDFRFDDFASQPVPLPPLAEQVAIVRFLDYMDRRIRKYVRAKQKLIKLLEEQKQAIIHRAVTRSLNPNVRLKPSGVEWLGCVPEHWEILRGKYVGKLFSTPSILDNDLTENGDNHPMYLKVSDLSHVDAKLKINKSVLYVKSRTVVAHRQDRAFLVFPKRGGAIYTNKVAIVETDFLLDPNLMGWEIGDRFDPHYVALLLKTRTLADLADVSSVPQLNNKHINPISFPAPPLTEQIEIISRLDSDLFELNATISRTHHAISLFREYRTRLISDVVTGKLDVREAAARLPYETDEQEPIDDAEPMDNEPDDPVEEIADAE